MANVAFHQAAVAALQHVLFATRKEQARIEAEFQHLPAAEVATHTAAALAAKTTALAKFTTAHGCPYAWTAAKAVLGQPYAAAAPDYDAMLAILHTFSSQLSLLLPAVVNDENCFPNALLQAGATVPAAYGNVAIREVIVNFLQDYPAAVMAGPPEQRVTYQAAFANLVAAGPNVPDAWDAWRDAQANARMCGASIFAAAEILNRDLLLITNSNDPNHRILVIRPLGVIPAAARELPLVLVYFEAIQHFSATSLEIAPLRSLTDAETLVHKAYRGRKDMDETSCISREADKLEAAVTLEILTERDLVRTELDAAHERVRLAKAALGAAGAEEIKPATARLKAAQDEVDDLTRRKDALYPKDKYALRARQQARGQWNRLRRQVRSLINCAVKLLFFVFLLCLSQMCATLIERYALAPMWWMRDKDKSYNTSPPTRVDAGQRVLMLWLVGLIGSVVSGVCLCILMDMRRDVDTYASQRQFTTQIMTQWKTVGCKWWTQDAPAAEELEPWSRRATYFWNRLKHKAQFWMVCSCLLMITIGLLLLITGSLLLTNAHESNSLLQQLAKAVWSDDRDTPSARIDDIQQWYGCCGIVDSEFNPSPECTGNSIALNVTSALSCLPLLRNGLRDHLSVVTIFAVVIGSAILVSVALWLLTCYNSCCGCCSDSSSSGLELDDELDGVFFGELNDFSPDEPFVVVQFARPASPNDMSFWDYLAMPINIERRETNEPDKVVLKQSQAMHLSHKLRALAARLRNRLSDAESAVSITSLVTACIVGLLVALQVLIGEVRGTDTNRTAAFAYMYASLSILAAFVEQFCGLVRRRAIHDGDHLKLVLDAIEKNLGINGVIPLLDLKGNDSDVITFTQQVEKEKENIKALESLKATIAANK